MQIITLESEEFRNIEDLLGEHADSTELELVSGIDCDEDDLNVQRENGDEDPMATIELIAQWNPNTKEGILDWYFVRESTINDEEPGIELGGPLLGFRYTEETPDLDSLVEAALPALNEVVDWAEFEMSDEEE